MSRRDSLLGRIARHGVSGLRDPREDRLTEICAALFESERCPGLAVHVALGWLKQAVGTAGHAQRFRDLLATLDDPTTWQCRASTQVRYLGIGDEIRRPDLQLHFSREDAPEEVLLWVEVKHGTPPHDRQLQAYLDELARRALRHSAVLLVAPRADYRTFADINAEQIPPEVPRLTWEGTAESLNSYSTADPVGQFLVADLLAYLKEESLVDPPKLTSDHLVALVQYREAHSAFERLCERASVEVTQRWNSLTETGSWPEKRNVRERWWTYEGFPRDDAPAALGDELSWNWDLLAEDSRDILKDGRAGVPCLLAGATGYRGRLARLPVAVRERLRASDFEVLTADASNSRDYEYLMRVLYLDNAGEVLHGETTADQAIGLSAWIVDAFTVLHRVLSPASE